MECPKCNEELIDMGYNKDRKRYEKECFNCGITYSRKKGHGYKWVVDDI